MLRLNCTHPPLLLLVALVIALASACGGKAPATQPDGAYAVGTGPGAAALSSDAANGGPDAAIVEPAPPSPLPAARALVGRALDSPKSIGKAVATADALADYLTAFPDVPDARAARGFAATLRLLAVGASAGLQTGPAARALGGDGAQARQLRKALAEVEALERGRGAIDGIDLGRLGLSVRALLGSDPDEKAIEFDRRAAIELATGRTAEGMAVRAKWLVRFERSLRKLRHGASELRFFGFARAAGRILCAGCSDAHHVTPDNVTKFLLNGKKNKGGLLCDRAFAGTVSKETTPKEVLERIKRCEMAFNVDRRVEDNAWWGANGLALATMATARQLTDAPVARTPLEAAVQKRVAALTASLRRPVVLPVPAILGPPPEFLQGRRIDAGTVGVVGLGSGGLTVTEEPLEIYGVAPDGFRAGLRTVVGYDEKDRIVSYTRRHSTLGTLLLSRSALESGKRNAQGAIEGLSDGIKRIRAAARKVASKHGLKVSRGDDRGAVAELIVDADASARNTITLIDTLRASGYGNFRFVKTAAHGRSLPVVVRSAPKDMVDAVKPGFQRPMIAVVHREYVDLWAPKGRLKTARKPTRKKAKLPEEVEAGYRGGNVVRFRIRKKDPTKKATGFDQSVTVKTQKGLRYFERWYGAGPLLHVIAASGARAADVLRVARTYQERRGKGEIDKPGTLWAGTACGGKSYVANRKQPEGCPTGVSVAFSGMGIPAARGLKTRFIEKKRKKKKRKKKSVIKVQQPGGGAACDKAQIQAVMNKHRAGFRSCYEGQLQVSPGLSGRVIMAFTIGTDGRVSGANIAKSTLKSTVVHKCLVHHVERARFKAPGSGVCQIRWPLRFQPL